MTTQDNNVNKKLSTGIAGLDAIFHGGIHIHKYEKGHKGIVMLARGPHGVNKIHLSMQICEGLQESNMKKKGMWINTVYALLFLKIRKDVDYYNKITIKTIDDYIQKLNKEADKEKEEWEKRRKEIENDENWFLNIRSSLLMNVAEDIVNQKFKSGFSVYPKLESILKFVKESDLLIENLITIDLLKRLYGDNYGESTIESAIQPLPIFISINKDSNLLKNSYYDFYIQRLFRDIRMDVDSERVNRAISLLYAMPWSKDDAKGVAKRVLKTYKFPSVEGSVSNSNGIEKFQTDIKTGFIYYNGRTHGLHVRHQKGSPKDTGELLLCKLNVPDDYKVRIIGKDTLNENNDSADGLTTFQKMMKELDKYADSRTEVPKTKVHQKENNNEGKKKTPVEFIMIDGLSRLNEEELAQCPLNALSDKLRSKSIVGIITADEKLLPSEVSTDIVIDMDIRQNEHPEHSNTALKISKCLYQKNAYGWHQYKMRNAGIEVIPSIHLQMGQRFIMDDIVTDAMLPANKYPYPYWLNEKESPFKDENMCQANEDYEKHLTGKDPTGKLIVQERQLIGYLVNKDSLTDFVKDKIKNGAKKNRHVLFVNLDKDRMEFIDDYLKGESQLENVHLFNFRPSYIHADEMLWALDQQIRAIEAKTRKSDPKKDKTLTTHYTHVSLVFGDLNYIHYAYPCLSKESLFLPALAAYTKRHHMTNYIFATLNNDYYTSDTELFKKEMETIMQMRKICKEFKEQK